MRYYKQGFASDSTASTPGSAPEPRINKGRLDEYTEDAIKDHLNIAEIICPLCTKHLLREDDLFHCSSCGLTGEVMLVVNRLVSDDDPHRLSIRLLQRNDTLTQLAWKHAEENDGFSFGSLPCPSCDKPITQLSEDATGEKPFCCQVFSVPRIEEISDDKPSRRKHKQPWKVSYDVKIAAAKFPTPNALRLIDLATYEQELARFAPKIETLAVEADPSPLEAVAASPAENLPPNEDTDDTKVKKALTLPVRGTDAITWFLRKFIRGTPTAIIPRHEFYEAYVHWIRKYHQEPLSDKIFYKHLGQLYTRVSSGQNRINGKRMRCYRGISLSDHDDLLNE